MSSIYYRERALLNAQACIIHIVTNWEGVINERRETGKLECQEPNVAP